jgi:hypothetical protein
VVSERLWVCRDSTYLLDSNPAKQVISHCSKHAPNPLKTLLNYEPQRRRGNYEVRYTSTARSSAAQQRGQPAGGRFRGRIGRLLFKTTGVFQSVLQPDIATNKVAFKMFGVLPGYVGLRGRIAPVGETGDTVKVYFQRPVLSFGGCLNIRIGERPRPAERCLSLSSHRRALHSCIHHAPWENQRHAFPPPAPIPDRRPPLDCPAGHHLPGREDPAGQGQPRVAVHLRTQRPRGRGRCAWVRAARPLLRACCCGRGVERRNQPINQPTHHPPADMNKVGIEQTTPAGVLLLTGMLAAMGVGGWSLFKTGLPAFQVTGFMLWMVAAGIALVFRQGGIVEDDEDRRNREDERQRERAAAAAAAAQQQQQAQAASAAAA